MKCLRGTVRNTVQRYRDSRTYRTKRRSGRKRVKSAREDRMLEMSALRNRTKSSKDLSNELLGRYGVAVSARTVRRRPVSAGLRARKARHKPLLTEVHKQKRLSWAKKYAHWSVDDWSKILWCDDSNIGLFAQPGAEFVRRRPGEAYQPDCMIPTVKHGGGSIMVWEYSLVH